LLASFVVASSALADPTVPAPAAQGSGTLQVPVIVIYGRPDKPNVVIVLQRPTATRAAGAAHEELHAALLAASQPPGLKQ
jgi:hypothetical protein